MQPVAAYLPEIPPGSKDLPYSDGVPLETTTRAAVIDRGSPMPTAVGPPRSPAWRSACGRAAIKVSAEAQARVQLVKRVAELEALLQTAGTSGR